MHPRDSDRDSDSDICVYSESESHSHSHSHSHSDSESDKNGSDEDLHGHRGLAALRTAASAETLVHDPRSDGSGSNVQRGRGRMPAFSFLQTTAANAQQRGDNLEVGESLASAIKGPTAPTRGAGEAPPPSLDALSADPAILIEQLLNHTRSLKQKASMASLATSVDVSTTATLVSPTGTTSPTAATSPLQLNLDDDNDLQVYKQLLLESVSRSASQARSKSVRRRQSRSKSVAPPRSKSRSSKSNPTPLPVLLYNVALFAMQMLVFVARALWVLGKRVVSSNAFQKHVQPKIDTYIVLPVITRRDVFVACIYTKVAQARALTWQDVRRYIMDTRAWLIASYLYWRNFDFKAYFTPKPKPPPPPPPPSKPFAQVWTEFMTDMQSRIDSVKQNKTYMLLSQHIAFLAHLSAAAGAWIWIRTAPLRSSVFGKRVLAGVLRVWRGAVAATVWVSRLEGVQRGMRKVRENVDAIVDAVVRLMVGITPLALITYSALLSSSGKEMDAVVLEAYRTFPMAEFYSIEAAVYSTSMMHGFIYSALATAYAGVVLWLYLPIVQANLAKKDNKNETHLTCYSYACRRGTPSSKQQLACYSFAHRNSNCDKTFSDKVDAFLHPSQSVLQKGVTVTILLLSILSLGVFQLSVWNIQSIAATLHGEALWTILNGPVQTAPLYMTQVRDVAHRGIPFRKMSQRVCDLTLNVPPTSIDFAYVQCKRREPPAPPSCHCPVHEIQSCHVVRRNLPSSADIHAVEISLACNDTNIPTLESQKTLYRLQRRHARFNLQSPTTPFDASWLPTPLKIFHANPASAPSLQPDPVHVAPRYESLTVAFTAPVADTPVFAAHAAEQAVNVTGAVRVGPATFRVDLRGRVPQGLLRLRTVSGCVEARASRRACAPGEVLVSVPRDFVGFRVSRAGGGNAAVVVEFEETVAVYQHGRYVREVGVGDVVARFNGVAVAVREVTELLKGSRVRVLAHLPRSLGLNGTLEVGVSTEVTGSRWPMLPVNTSMAAVDVRKGICCGVSASVAALHPSECGRGWKFVAGSSCAKRRESIASAFIAPVGTFDLFLGTYLDQKVDFEAGVRCPDGFELQTSSVNITLQGLHAFTQVCARGTAIAPKSVLLTRYLHVKPSPPTVNIISAAWMNKTHIEPAHVALSFNFSLALLNGTIPHEALNIRFSRDGVDLGVAAPVEAQSNGGEWRANVYPSSNWTHLYEGDSLQLHVEAVKSARTGGDGWFSSLWVARSSETHDGWNCTDATPPYGPCTEVYVSVPVVAPPAIASCEFGGFLDTGDGALVRVHFTSPVAPRFDTIRPEAFQVAIGKTDSLTKSRLPLQVTKILALDKGGRVIPIIVNVTEKDFKPKELTLSLAILDGNLVGLTQRGRAYVSSEAFMISVESLLHHAPKSAHWRSPPTSFATNNTAPLRETSDSDNDIIESVPFDNRQATFIIVILAVLGLINLSLCGIVGVVVYVGLKGLETLELSLNPLSL
ncbi:hypothetical protein BC830DRAFT_1147823 [Chytriomyces sp. MP71]|nr:hypothetical protein BC830DRAFT_1147823 [Chytriomyces sp. MP71]